MTKKSARNPTSVPLNDHLAGRWSPRGFDGDHVISDEDLTALGEAARWAPSANNLQPAHFIVARRGTPTFETIVSALRHFNRDWAPRAALLLVAVAETSRDGKPLRYAEYDTGQAVAHLTVEAEARGLNVRQMGGISVSRIQESFALPPDLVPLTVVAGGKHDTSDGLPADLRERDATPRHRRGLDELAIVLDT